MSTVTVVYRLSVSARIAEAQATGDMPAETQIIAVELSELAPEQRAAVLAYAGTRTTARLATPALGVRGWDEPCVEFKRDGLTYQGVPVLDADILDVRPDMPTIVSALATRNEQYAAALAECETALTAWEQKHAAEAAERAEREEQEKAERKERARRGVAEEERKAALRAQREAERAAWAQEHGSEHLKRAVAAGYNCARMYAIERAAVEYPGCVLDYEEHAECKSRSCPSLAALDTCDAIHAAHPEAKAVVVWLTAEPRERTTAEDRMEDECADGYPDELGFADREAVQIDDPAYSRYLYDMLES